MASDLNLQIYLSIFSYIAILVYLSSLILLSYIRTIRNSFSSARVIMSRNNDPASLLGSNVSPRRGVWSIIIQHAFKSLCYFHICMLQFCVKHLTSQLSTSTLPSLLIPSVEKADLELNEKSTVGSRSVDTASCLKLLIDVYSHLLSPNASPKTPLMLLNECVKSVSRICDRSDYWQRVPTGAGVAPT